MKKNSCILNMKNSTEENSWKTGGTIKKTLFNGYFLEL